MAEGKFIISAQNKTAEGLNAAQKDLNGFQGAVNGIGKSIESALNFTAIAASAGIALKKISDAAIDCYKEFGEMDRRMQLLKISLGGNEESFSRNTDLIGKLTTQTLSSKDSIESLISELAALGKSDSQIEAIATAAVSLANITGKDVNTSFQQLNGTYTGTIGRLAQLIPEIKDLSKEQLAAGAAIDLINQKLTPVSEQLAENNIPQKLKNLKDKFGDLKETLGGLLAPLFTPMLDYLRLAIDGWSDLGAIIESTSFKFMGLVDSPQAISQAILTLQNLILIEQSNLKDYDRKIADLKTKLGGKSSPELQALIEERTRLGKYIQELVGQSQALTSGKKPSEVFATGVGGGGGAGGAPAGDDALTKLLKTNYDTVDKLVAAISQILTINENHPDYYSPDQLKSFIDLFRGRIYSAETLQLGPEGVQRLDDAKTLFQYFQTLIPEPKIYAEYVSSAVADSLSTLFPSSISGLAGGLSFKTLMPTQEQSDNQMVADYDEYLNDVKTITQLGAESMQQMFDTESRASVQANLDITAAAVEKLRDIETNPEYLYTPQSTPYANNSILSSWSKPALSTGIAGGLSFQIAMPSKEAADTQMVADYEAYLDDVKSLGTAAEQSARQLKSTSENAGLLTSVFASLISAKDSIIASFTSVKTSISSGADSELLDSINSIMAAISPFGQIIAGVNPALALAIPIIEGFSEVMSSAITDVLEPFTDALTGIGIIIAENLLPIFDALYPIISLVASILQTVFAPVLQLISPIISVIAGILDALSPILTLLAKAFIYVMAPIKWVSDMLTALGTNIGVFIYNLSHWFNPKEYVEVTSDAFSSIQDKIDEIDAISTNSGSISSGVSSSTATASASASYRTQSITINIYQQAPVVGSGGMTEFARMIRGEFLALGYYGA